VHPVTSRLLKVKVDVTTVAYDKSNINHRTCFSDRGGESVLDDVT
jgi:hypothetical protein